MKRLIKLTKYLPLHCLDQIHKMMICSHLDYYDVIYHVPLAYAFPFTLNSLIEKLERIQYNAAMAITGTWRGTNRPKLYEGLERSTMVSSAYPVLQNTQFDSAIPERSSSSYAFLPIWCTSCL